jgi:hypothetical protein
LRRRHFQTWALFVSSTFEGVLDTLDVVVAVVVVGAFFSFDSIPSDDDDDGDDEAVVVAFSFLV